MASNLLTSTIPAQLAAIAARHGDRIAIEDEENQLTWHDLQHQANQAARAFIALGVEVGERVAIWAPNIREWIVAALGAQSAGAVLVPVSTRM